MGSGSGIHLLTSLLRFQGSDTFYEKQFKQRGSISLLLFPKTKLS